MDWVPAVFSAIVGFAGESAGRGVAAIKRAAKTSIRKIVDVHLRILPPSESQMPALKGIFKWAWSDGFFLNSGVYRLQPGEQKPRILVRARRYFPAMLLSVAMIFFGSLAAQEATGPARTLTFYRDVLRLLQGHCQVCHRAGGIAPLAFDNYEETRRYAVAMQAAVQSRSMPPWFAENG